MSESAGLFMQGFGMVQSAKAQKSAGKYNKQVADYNAGIAEYRSTVADYNVQIAEYQSQDAVGRGELEVGQYRKQVKALVGDQRAKLAAQGQDLESGSAAEVQQDAAYLGEYDALMIRNNAAREAWGYKVQAYNAKVQGYDYRVQAWNDTVKGQMSEREANSKAMTTLLGGTTNIAMRYGFGSAPKKPDSGFRGWVDT